MQPFKLDETTEVDVGYLSFDSRGRRFQGSGRLKWDPKEGFRLEAIIKPKREFKGKIVIPLGKAGPVPRKCFRFEIEGSWKAICPNVFFSDWEEIALNLKQTVAVEFYNLILFSHRSYVNDGQNTYGRCFFKVRKNSVFPDKVNYEVKIADETFFRKQKLQGLSLDNELIKLVGFLNETGQFEVLWQPSNKIQSKQDEWNIAVAIKDALSLCLGQTAYLVKRDLYRKNKTVLELITSRDVNNLGAFAPLMKEVTFDKELFLVLFKIFLKNDIESVIIRNLFYRIADAVHTHNSDLWAFMLSSALEGFLRTYFNKPYPKRFSWKNSLEQFRNLHFRGHHENEWKKIFSAVSHIYDKFRNKNAHPDWCRAARLNSHEASQKEFDDLVLLSKFYGYVILALAGYKDLEPKGIRNMI